MKQSADDNFEFDVNSRKFSKLVENTVEKGEIARYEQFLLFPQCFQKDCFPGASKGVIVREWINTRNRALTETSILYTDEQTNTWRNTHPDSRIHDCKICNVQGYDKNLQLNLC